MTTLSIIILVVLLALRELRSGHLVARGLVGGLDEVALRCELGRVGVVTALKPPGRVVIEQVGLPREDVHQQPLRASGDLREDVVSRGLHGDSGKVRGRPWPARAGKRVAQSWQPATFFEIFAQHWATF